MNRDGANGSCVVEAVLEKLNDSGIFPLDHGFMRRIAHVETRDGTNNIIENTNVLSIHKRIGIWGLTEFMLQNMRHQLKQHISDERYQSLNGSSELIYKAFGVNMTELENLNLRIPLVSGIAARFYLHYLTVLTNAEIPKDLEGQAVFWASQYRINGNPTIFTDGSIEGMTKSNSVL